MSQSLRNASILILAVVVSFSSANAFGSGFTKNIGQWPDSILYRAEADGGVLWFVKDGIYYQFSGNDGSTQDVIKVQSKSLLLAENFDYVLLDFTQNYYTGNDSTLWFEDVPSFESISYRCEKFSAEFSINSGLLSCKITSDRHATLEDIGLSYVGALLDTIENAPVLVTSAGLLPICGGLPRPNLGAPRNIQNEQLHTAESIQLDFSQSFGSTNDDNTAGISMSSDGRIYLVGTSVRSGFPALSGNKDVFILAFDSVGILRQATYLAGTGDDVVTGVTCANGLVAIVGRTQSIDFPVRQAIKTDILPGDIDGFFASFSLNTLNIHASSYIGGAGEDACEAIEFINGAVTIAGSTASTTLVGMSASPSSMGRQDAFVSRWNPLLVSPVSTIRFGGDGYDEVKGICGNSKGTIFACGYTESTNFPQSFPKVASLGAHDLFFTRLDSGLNAIEFSYTAGMNVAEGEDIVATPEGNLYVVGRAVRQLPLVNPLRADLVRGAVLFGFDGKTNDLILSTYLFRGEGLQSGYAIDSDSAGYLYLTGRADTDDLELVQEFSSFKGDDDNFIIKLQPHTFEIDFATYFGGSGEDYSSDLRVDNSGRVLLSGMTGSPDFPRVYANQLHAGSSDAFLARFLPQGTSCCRVIGELNCGIDQVVDIADVTVLVDHLFLSFTPLCCEDAAQIDGVDLVDIGDLTVLVDHLFISFAPLGACQ